MKNVLLSVLMAAMFVAMVAIAIGNAGNRAVVGQFINVTTTDPSAMVVDLTRANEFAVQVAMNNWTGALTISRSYDGGQTYLNYTTSTTDKAAYRFFQPAHDVPTHLKVTAVNAFADYTGTETHFKHTTPGLNVNVTVDETR